MTRRGRWVWRLARYCSTLTSESPSVSPPRMDRCACPAASVSSPNGPTCGGIRGRSARSCFPSGPMPASGGVTAISTVQACGIGTSDTAVTSSSARSGQRTRTSWRSSSATRSWGVARSPRSIHPLPVPQKELRGLAFSQLLQASPCRRCPLGAEGWGRGVGWIGELDQSDSPSGAARALAAAAAAKPAPLRHSVETRTQTEVEPQP